MSLSNPIWGCFRLPDRKLGHAWKSEPGHPFRARVWGARQCYWWKQYSYLLTWLVYAHQRAGRALVDCGSAGLLHHHLHHHHQQAGLLQEQAVRREDPRRRLSEKKWPTEPSVSEKLWNKTITIYLFKLGFYLWLWRPLPRSLLLAANK